MDVISNLPARPIVVGADGSGGSDRAVRWAAREAVTVGAPLRIVTAWAVPIMAWPATMAVAYIDPADVRVGALANLDRARTLALAAVGSLPLHIELVDARGGPAETLLAHAGDGALLVVGTRGHGGFASLVLGSVASACAHHSSVPLAVIGDDAPPPGTGAIVVGVDDSPGGRAALRWAAAEAQLVGADLHVVHGWSLPARGPEALGIDWGPGLDEAARAGVEHLVAEELGVLSSGQHLEVSAVVGSAAEVLIAEAKGAALLVVGSRGRGGVRELLLGSVGQHCLHHSTGPVVIVPNGARTPNR